VEHLEKGLLFLNRGVKFEVLSWPGTNDVIPETTRNGLEVGLHHICCCLGFEVLMVVTMKITVLCDGTPCIW
jgi:hypothetical protein